MSGVVVVLGWGACAGGIAGAIYAIACVFAVARFGRTGKPDPAAPQAITVMKPLHGAEPGLRQNLETFCDQDYGAPVQLVLGVSKSDSGGLQIANEFRAARKDCDIAIVAGTTSHGSNPKISNLLNMVIAAKHDVLAISDSDIGVPRDYLATITAALEMPGTGVVTCCYTGRPSVPGVWAQLSAMGVNQHFLPDVLFALAHDLAAPCFGSTIAIKRSVLEEIGGLRAFADRLADDYEIGFAVRARGYRIAVPHLTVAHACAERSFGELMRHELRWARTIRLINPKGFAGSILTHAMPLALTGCLLLGFAPVSIAIFGIAAAARVWLLTRINRQFSLSDPIWLVLPRDLLSFAVFAGALFATRVDWRGARFTVSSAGAIAPDQPVQDR